MCINKETRSVTQHNICDKFNVENLNIDDVENKIKALSTNYLEYDKIKKPGWDEEKCLRAENKMVPRITCFHKGWSNQKKTISKQIATRKKQVIYCAMTIHNSGIFYCRLFHWFFN